MAATPNLPEKIVAARWALAKDMPYLSSALFNVAWRESHDPLMYTMGIDQYWRCYYNAEFIEKTPIDELKAVLYHELNHVIREHGDRQKAHGAWAVMGWTDKVKQPDGSIREVPRVYTVWNLCADAAINRHIPEFHQSNSTAVLPRSLGLSEEGYEEEYYDVFMRKHNNNDNMECPQCKQEEKEQLQNKGSKGQDGQGSGGQEPESNNKNGKTSKNSGGVSCPRHGGPVIFNPCGSGADGQVQPWEDPERGEDGVGKAEQDALRKITAEKIKEHVKQAGGIPGGWDRWADEYLTVHVPFGDLHAHE